jgi:DNA-binding CsgD family transcriptional regulator
MNEALHILEPLTVRENEVAAHLASGRRNKEIAGRLNISRRTLEIHCAEIRRKTGAETTLQAALFFARKLGKSPDSQTGKIVRSSLIVNAKSIFPK